MHSLCIPFEFRSVSEYSDYSDCFSDRMSLSNCLKMFFPVRWPFFPQRTQIQLVGFLEAAKRDCHWLGVSQSWPQGEGNEGNSIWDADLKEHKAGKGWKRCMVFRNKIFSRMVQHGPGASWTMAGAARTNKSFFSRDNETFHRLCAHRTWLRQLWSW